MENFVSRHAEITVGRQLQILVVEKLGGASSASALLARIQWAEVRTTVTCTGEALQRLKKARYDLVLLDAGDLNSELLAQIKKAPHDVPVIALIEGGTSEGGEEQGAALLLAGAADFVTRDDTEGAVLSRAIRHAVERSSLKQALKESEERIRLFMDNTPAFVFIKDEEGRYVYLNRAIERLVKTPAAQLLGKTTFDRLPQEYAEQLRENSRLVLDSGQPHEFEEIVPTADGSLHHEIVVKFPFGVMDDRRLVGGIAVDITERRQAEEALQKERDFISAVIDTAGSLVLVLDRGGRIVRFNRACEQLTGYGFEEVRMQYVIDVVIDADNKADCTAKLDRIYSGYYPSRFESTWTARDGGRFLIEWSNTALLDAEGAVEYIIATGIDITERKRMEDSLRESEERFRQMAENAHEMFWLTDPKTGEMLYVSPAYEQIWGRSCQSLYERPESFAEAVHPQDTARLSMDLDGNTDDGEFEREYRIVRPDGTIRWVWDRAVPVLNERGEVYRIAGIAQDITERKRTEVELLASQEHLQAALDSGHIGLWDWNIDTGEVEYSAQWKNQLGYEEHELGNSFAEWESRVHPEDKHAAVARTEQDGSHYRSEFRMRHKDGSYRWILAQATIFRRPDGTKYRMMGSHIDITALKVTEADLRASREALQHAHDDLEQRVQRRTAELAQINKALQAEISERQMAVGALSEVVGLLEHAKEEAEHANRAKSEFLSRMSHELRTPLNAILGFGQVLEAEELTPLQEESVGHILKGGDHLLGLINEVLDLSRMDAGKINLSMEPVPLWDVIKESLDLVRPLASQRDVQLYDDANNGCFGHVLADRQRLKQVIINLLSNAVKYNVRGGRVAVSCQRLQNGRLRFGVEDTGPGISRENIEKIFIPFERLSYDSSDVEGTGLGLPLSRRLTEAMGGTLAVQSLPEQGSIFYVELPCADSPVEQLNREIALQGNLPVAAVREKSYTVLLVEDNLSNIRLIETIFQSRPNVQLISTMYGVPAQKLALQHEPDLVLLDLHLPDITGEEVLTGLKEDAQTKEIPVIVCSADATSAQIREVLSNGALNYLTKPLNVRQFLAVVDEVLDKPED